MRILLMTNSYRPVLGGLQTVTHQLATQLIARGHDVTVVTCRYPRSLAAYEQIDTVPVHRRLWMRPKVRDLARRRIDLFLAGLALYGPELAHARKLAASLRPDVLNVHFPDVQIPFARVAKRAADCRLVVSLHGHDIDRYYPPNGACSAPGKSAQNDLSRLLGEAEAVTACSRVLIERAARIQPVVHERAHVVFNGVDPVRFQNRDQFAHDRRYALAIGRLIPGKGFDMLIEALHRSGVGLDLIIAGEGDELVPLQQRAKERGLQDRVRFFGRATPQQVVELINGSAVVAVPSRSEQFGIVALEALAAGRPLIATRVGGMATFLDDAVFQGLGVEREEGPIQLVEPTEDALADALRALEGDRYAAESARLRDAVLERFTVARAADRFEAILAGRQV